MTRPPLPTPTLSTTRLLLRPFDDTDADDLFALHSSASRAALLGRAAVERTRSRASGSSLSAGRWRGGHRGAAGRGPCLRRGVHRGCSLNRWKPEYRSASLGYCSTMQRGPRLRHGGRARAAPVGFETLDLNRVQAETDTRNVASARVLGKFGFVREGTLRETAS